MNKLKVSAIALAAAVGLKAAHLKALLLMV